MQDPWPSLDVKVPLLQAPHCRSAFAVASLVVYSPLLQGARTAVHSSALSADENVEPTAHGAQVRSFVALPMLLRPQPAGQVRHGVHAWAPEMALNVPSPQGLHWRFAPAVGVTVSYQPAPQGARTGIHASAPALGEYVYPAEQAAHLRST